MARDLRDNLAANNVLLVCVCKDLEEIADLPELWTCPDGPPRLLSVARDIRPLVARVAAILRELPPEPRIAVEIPVEWEDVP